jgi:hypothetical protein
MISRRVVGENCLVSAEPKTTSLLFDYEGLSVGEQVAAGITH